MSKLTLRGRCNMRDGREKEGGGGEVATGVEQGSEVLKVVLAVKRGMSVHGSHLLGWASAGSLSLNESSSSHDD